MKTAVFHAPGKITCDTINDPKIEDQIKVTSTDCCGSNLHMYCGEFLSEQVKLNDIITH